MRVIPALERQRQEDLGFKAILSYMSEILSQKKKFK
jgi:hypothetical protein